MCFRPLPDQAPSRLRTNVADYHSTSEVKLASLSLVFSVKVRRLVLVVEHPDYDPEKYRDCRHPVVPLEVLVLAQPVSRAVSLI